MAIVGRLLVEIQIDLRPGQNLSGLNLGGDGVGKTGTPEWCDALWKDSAG
jgi:hypothetical protein